MDAIGFRIDAPETKPVEPWRKTLMDAADYIEAHGWCQGRDLYGERVCLVGAIAMVGGGKFMQGRLIASVGGEPAQEARHRMLLHGQGGEWNDAPGRTAAEVCAALRACAVS